MRYAEPPLELTLHFTSLALLSQPCILSPTSTLKKFPIIETQTQLTTCLSSYRKFPLSSKRVNVTSCHSQPTSSSQPTFLSASRKCLALTQKYNDTTKATSPPLRGEIGRIGIVQSYIGTSERARRVCSIGAPGGRQAPCDIGAGGAPDRGFATPHQARSQMPASTVHRVLVRRQLNSAELDGSTHGRRDSSLRARTPGRPGPRRCHGRIPPGGGWRGQPPRRHAEADIDVDQVARVFVLVATNHASRGSIHPTQPIQLPAHQHAMDGRGRHLQADGDPDWTELGAASQSLDPALHPRRCPPWAAQRPGAPIEQTRLALSDVPMYDWTIPILPISPRSGGGVAFVVSLYF